MARFVVAQDELIMAPICSDASVLLDEGKRERDIPQLQLIWLDNYVECLEDRQSPLRAFRSKVCQPCRIQGKYAVGTRN